MKVTKKIIISSLFFTIMMFSFSYALWAYIAEYSEKVINEKYNKELDNMFSMLIQKEKEEEKRKIEEEKRGAKKDFLNDLSVKISNNLIENRKSDISNENINFLAIPNITNLEGKTIEGPFGNLIIKNTSFDKAEEVLDNNVAFSMRSEKLGILIGHSSSLSTGPTLYRKAFAFLDKIQIGDNIVIGGKKYIVTRKEVVKSDISGVNKILEEPKMPTLRLVTCYPIGTANKRLILDLVEVVTINTI